MSTISRKFTVLAAFALAVSAALIAVPGTASATHQGSPTVQELLRQCNDKKTDYCAFKPNGALQIFDGERMLAGSSTNCTKFNQTRVIRYEASTGTKNSWGVEMSVGTNLFNIFDVSIKGSYQREWSSQDTTADEIRQDVGPRSRVDIYVSKQKSRVSGTWEMHFGRPYYGHYYWYVNGQVEGQTKGQPWHMYAQPVKAKC